MVEKTNAGKWQLILMILIVVGVLVAGFMVFPKNDQQREALLSKIGTTNHGELLTQPAMIQPLLITTQDGEPWQFDQLKTKWRMLIVGDAVCEEACRDMLFVTRQIHLRLGKYAQRFERIYVSTEPALSSDLAEEITTQHPYLKIVHVDGGELDAWLKTMGIAPLTPGITLLVDQKGLAMMRYGAEHNGGGMLEDINHLMKYSADR